uniref:Uncharacterized protein n=1 Tax=Arundo donax TaxID=35708 RepID=A0A0A9GAE0_ARUDO
MEAKERKKDKKDKKRKRDEKRDKKDDSEYLEKKRLKKEKKRMEKELARKQQEGAGVPNLEQQNTVKPSFSQEVLPARPPAPVRGAEPVPVRSAEPQVSSKETTVDTVQTTAKPKIRIRVKPLQRQPGGS